ncbi:MAG TPA: glutathione S-transferase N-terminal domain-containing protein [Gammaproteobacteria bacterium]|nr:glutathione S-transferase N-terminal domain-containing protein [Gammaproteobacteria bacterium]
MKLIGSLTSPYVRKVRVVLAEKEIDCQLLLEDVWAADTKIQQSNPLGKVPCLILDDDSALYDSRVICEYLDAFPPVNSLIPPAFPERILVRRWEALADGVLDAGVLVRLEHTQREPAQRSEAWLERQRRKVTAGLAAMAQDLGSSDGCLGGRFTLADIALGCALGWLSFRLPELDWHKTHANLGRHFDRLSLRPSFASSAPRA